MMPETNEISERRPWTVEIVLEHLERIDVFEVTEIVRALAREKETLAAALRDALKKRSARARLFAAVLLLLLNDTSGKVPFLDALAGPDGDVRALAIEFLQ